MKRRLGQILALVLAAGMIGTSPAIQVFAEEMNPVQNESWEEAQTDDNTEVLPGEDSSEAPEVLQESQESQESETPEALQGSETPEVSQPEKTEKPEDSEETAETAAVAEAPEVSAYAVSGNLFDDVGDSSWYLPYVTYVLNKGIMTGKGDNVFAPAEALARAQFAVVLWRISGAPETGYAGTYPDVLDGQFYTSAVEWASGDDVGVIGGYENGKFGPGDNITREQLVTMLYRYAKYRNLDMSHSSELSAFPDAGNVTAFALEAMKWAVGSGIITGDKGNINPQGNTNRAECAAMLQRFCDTYMPGELQDVDLSAGCGWSGITVTDEKTGAFWMKVTDVTAAQAISKVQAKIWCYDDGSDAGIYDLGIQSDGSYGALGSPRYHANRGGTYKMQAYVLLKNGVRIPVGDVQTAELTKSSGYYQVMNYVQNIYATVGYDLSACYWWCVNNISYRTLPIPLEPAAGYTRAEWYAMQAFLYGSGNCYVYAAAFYFCALGLGYNAEFIEGQVPLISGGYGPHGWVMIHQNGASYICDPESQRDIGGYNFYMQPVSNPVLPYVW